MWGCRHSVVLMGLAAGGSGDYQVCTEPTPSRCGSALARLRGHTDTVGSAAGKGMTQRVALRLRATVRLGGSPPVRAIHPAVGPGVIATRHLHYPAPPRPWPGQTLPMALPPRKDPCYTEDLGTALRLTSKAPHQARATGRPWPGARAASAGWAQSKGQRHVSRRATDLRCLLSRSPSSCRERARDGDERRFA